MSISKTKLILKCRNELIDIHRHALEAIKPENIIRDSIQVSEKSLVVKSRTRSSQYDLSDTRVHVVGGGKSVVAMARGLAEIAKQSNIHGLFSHGSLSIPVGLESSTSEKILESIAVKCHIGSKSNLPDEASVEASKQILEAISNASDSDRTQKLKSLFIVLISGGGSACLTSPRYVSLSKKLDMIKFLVQRGANIVELNKVRRYYSNIKGGGLARYILSKNPDSKILSLILSDVIGDPIEFIASGPTHFKSDQSEQSQMQQAHEVLTRFGYPMKRLETVESNDHSENPMRFNPEASVVNHIIGNNRIAIDAALRRAQSFGYDVVDLGGDLQGNTGNVVDKLVEVARERFERSKSNQLLVIGGGEATVIKGDHETWGKGGRVQEMALDYMISCFSEPNTNKHQDVIDLLFAGTTDGQDGPTDIGACFASYAELMNDCLSEKFKLEDPLIAKTGHDSNNFWRTFRPQWLINTGLTGTNVMDLYMYSLVKLHKSPAEVSKL